MKGYECQSVGERTARSGGFNKVILLMMTGNRALECPIRYPLSLLCHVASQMTELKCNETGYLGSGNKGMGVQMSGCTSSNFSSPPLGPHV